jgi:hypothetical protein
MEIKPAIDLANSKKRTTSVRLENLERLETVVREFGFQGPEPFFPALYRCASARSSQWPTPRLASAIRDPRLVQRSDSLPTGASSACARLGVA